VSRRCSDEPDNHHLLLAAQAIPRKVVV